MRRRGKCEHGDDRMADYGQRKLLQVKRRRFFQICHGVFHRLALGRGARLRIEGNETTFFGVSEDGSQFHSSSPGVRQSEF